MYKTAYLHFVFNLCLKTSAKVKRWERVDWKLEQRRGDKGVISTTAVACFAEVCRRHVPSPATAKQRCESIATGFKTAKLTLHI
jgi:hypothetical protein